jgi:outer membrane protein
MKRNVLVLFLLLSGICFAQQKKDSIHKLSLQQSIAYAMDHQGNMINARYEVDKAGSKVKEIVGMGLPQISGTVNIQDFLDIPTTLIPGQFFGGKPGTFDAVKFGVQYNTTAEVDGSQLIFDGTFIVGLQASHVYKQLAEKSLTQTTIQTSAAVSKAYYTVLVSYWRLQMFHADVTRLKKLLDETEAMYKNGFTEKIDWERIKVNYNNLKTQETNIGRLVLLSQQLLKFQMGMEQSDSLALTDSLKSITMNPEAQQDSAFKLENRIEYSLAETNVRASQLLLQKDKFSYLPNLALYGSISEGAPGNTFEIFSSAQTWYPTAIVGLRMGIPIFDGLQKGYRVQQDKIGVMESQTQMNTIKQSIYLDLKNSFTNLQNALADLKNQEENMTLAQSVEHDAKVKYEAGTGSNLEVIDAETALTESETNYYNALFNALVAKVDYEQAKGTLYNKK